MYIHTYTHKYIQTHTYMHTHTHPHKYTYIHTHAHTHIHTNTYIHTCTSSPFSRLFHPLSVLFVTPGVRLLPVACGFQGSSFCYSWYNNAQHHNCDCADINNLHCIDSKCKCGYPPNSCEYLFYFN